MKVLEIEGKTIDEAIEKACREFNVPREKLNIEILSEGSSGFFGLVGSKKARVKASLLNLEMSFDLPAEKKARAPEAPPAPRPQERPQERLQERPQEHKEQKDQREHREQQRPPREHREQRDNRPPREARPPREQHPYRDNRPPREPREIRPPREQREAQAPREPRPEPREIRPPREPREMQTPREPRPEPVESSPETLAAAKETLQEILARMGIEAQVTVEDTPEAVSLTLQGVDEGLLIGKRGQTLDALQYVVNKILSKQGREKKQVIVDTEDYRKKREEALVALAEKVSQKVRKTRKPITLGNMTARERRIIHLTLQNDDSVITKSRGEGLNRKIIVKPGRSNRPHNSRPR
ncbi:MAG TPA: RNA-binding cell elongation regulator Jag/EloR [Syntrophales bacterium]|nr:RNA-binding cell elongation regulator Jag/EloR [Syntrophales bacterium]